MGGHCGSTLFLNSKTYFVFKIKNWFDLEKSPVWNVLYLVAAGGAPEGSAAKGFPGAELGPPGSAAAEAVESGEDSAGAGVTASEAGLVAAQPQAALLPQTVEAGLQEGHRVEGYSGGTGMWEGLCDNGVSCAVLPHIKPDVWITLQLTQWKWCHPLCCFVRWTVWRTFTCC